MCFASVFPLSLQYANKKIPGGCLSAVPGFESLKEWECRLQMPCT